MESNAVSQSVAYGLLPQPTGGKYELTSSYITKAKKTTATQLSRAGVRLAFVLNNALGTP